MSGSGPNSTELAEATRPCMSAVPPIANVKFYASVTQSDMVLCLQPQQPLGIAVADLGTHQLTERRRFDEGCGGLRVFIGIVDGEHHAVLAERRDGVGERPRGADA